MRWKEEGWKGIGRARRTQAGRCRGARQSREICAPIETKLASYVGWSEATLRIEKWGPALLPAPTAPSEGYAGVRSTLDPAPENRFVTPLLDPGSPAQASLSTEPLPLARSPIDLPDCAARRFAGLSTFLARLLEPRSLEAKTTQCSAALLGSTTLRVPLRSSDPNSPQGGLGDPRTASRWRKSTLPAPLPGWPEKNRSPSHSCRRRSDLWSPAASATVAGLGEAGTAVPITCSPCTCVPSRKSEKYAVDPVDNGDIGHNCRNLFRFAESARALVAVPFSSA
jgi:hypothetical protein